MSCLLVILTVELAISFTRRNCRLQLSLTSMLPPAIVLSMKRLPSVDSACSAAACVQEVLSADGYGAIRRMDKKPAALTLSPELRPTVVFENAHAITYVGTTKAWIRSAGWKWPASEFHAAYAASSTGQSGATLRADASVARPRQHLLGTARAVRVQVHSLWPASCCNPCMTVMAEMISVLPRWQRHAGRVNIYARRASPHSYSALNTCPLCRRRSGVRSRPARTWRQRCATRRCCAKRRTGCTP